MKFKKVISILILVALLINTLGIYSFAASNDCCDNEYWVNKVPVAGTKYELWVSKEHVNITHSGFFGQKKHINLVVVENDKPKIKLRNYHIWGDERCINYWDSKTGTTGSFCSIDMASAIAKLGSDIGSEISRNIPEITFVGVVSAIGALLWYIVQNFWWVVAF